MIVVRYSLQQLFLNDDIFIDTRTFHQTKIDKFALEAKNSVIDLYNFGYAIEDYLGGPENKGPCDQDCIDQNIDFILDKFYSKWGSRLFDVTGEELKLYFKN